MSHMKCLFCKVSCIYLKEKKERILLYLHQNALNGQKSQERTISMQHKQYQNPSQYYKMLFVKIVWTNAATY